MLDILILIVILIVVFYLAIRFVVPIIPAPWGKIVLAIVAIIVIIYILNRFFGLGL